MKIEITFVISPAALLNMATTVLSSPADYVVEYRRIYEEFVKYAPRYKTKCKQHRMYIQSLIDSVGYALRVVERYPIEGYPNICEIIVERDVLDSIRKLEKTLRLHIVPKLIKERRTTVSKA